MNWEDKQIGVIDGKRSISEIIKLVADGISKKRALKFFQRLWQYDQVVFDLSEAFSS